MSDKSKVYPGVRVKTTVRELLQRHRAREANRTHAKPLVSQACLDLQELSASLYPTAPAPVSDLSSLQVSYPASYSVSESLSSSQTQDLNTYNNNFQHQLWDAVLPGNSGPGNHLHPHIYQHQQNPPQHHSGQHQPGLPPSWNQALSSDADYYGPGMTSCSPADSLKMCSPEDHSGYSPHNSFSSSSSTSSSSCYDSPSRLESSFCSPEPYLYTQHYLSQDSYNVAHLCMGQQESFTSEYAPCYTSMDYVYPCTDESFYKRDLTAEIYNAL
ncbi:colorectal cancer associated 2 [Periophthalmus magnuspinnatus]|uniref:colorectal cancer associated 2 n=1 Tax=Periophthalmus magnuspinnatus TaxID=409849 RepID=UPI002436EBB9|nr:colorectal cancer associated 2 [Periophthalmus magnuspinnatus]